MGGGLFVYRFGRGTLYAGPPYLIFSVSPDEIISLDGLIRVEHPSAVRRIYHIYDGTAKPPSMVAKALAAIHRGLSAGKKVYVHCIGGCGRTGTVTIAFLMLYAGMELEKAYRLFYEARGCGPETDRQILFLHAIRVLLEAGLPVEDILGLMKDSPTEHVFWKKAMDKSMER